MSATARQPTFTLITGGNSGIGLELARQAAADGRNLILVAQNTAALEAAEAELNRNVKVHTISQDLSQPGAAEIVYDQRSDARRRGGLPDQQRRVRRSRPVCHQ